MDKEGLRQFLVASNEAGYAGGKSKEWIHEADHSVTIPFEKGSWKSHDNFFGGEPYGGRTVVFYEGNPTWIMVYYGWVAEGQETGPVYGILRGALKQMPEDYPFRGPKEYKEGEFTYTNAWKGDVERFSGEEQITKGEEVIYKANYRGGLVDQRKGV
jgi:hypothetical protein